MSDDAFGSLIAPVTTAAFFAHTFEREVLHVARGDAAAVAGLYAIGDVENALILGANEPDHFALIKAGAEALASEEFTSARTVVRNRAARKASRALVDPRAVLDAFARGYTLNIKDASAYHPPLALLCNRIQTQLGMYVQANAYFTPPRAQGFDIHYDTHDTLIVQIEGEKAWQVHAPVVPLPLEIQPFSAAAHAGKLDTPREYLVRAGDALYIPHGFPHCAKTAEQRSLHLTFAISPIRLVDLMDAAIQVAALADPALRAALPPGWQTDPAFAARASAQLAALVPRAIAPERLPLAAEFAFNDLFGSTRTTAAGGFDTLAAFERLGGDARIRVRDDSPIHVRDRGERLDLVLAGKVVTIPALARAALARLRSGPATFAEVDALVPDGLGRTLLRTLVLNELVFIEDASPVNPR